jgi:hypothetical protein
MMPAKLINNKDEAALKNNLSLGQKNSHLIQP